MTFLIVPTLYGIIQCFAFVIFKEISYVLIVLELFVYFSFIFKINVIADILRESGAELIVVPGNNDIATEIEKLLPGARVVKNNTKIEIDGVECRVGHEVSSMTFDKTWSFYGHGFTGDRWSPSENTSVD